MTRHSIRVAALATLAVTVGATPLALVTPATGAAPQNACSGAFCTSTDLGAFDALAPTQPTSAAAQPTDLVLTFDDTSPTVATAKNTWLAKVSAQLGATSAKAFAVTDPATLPLGSYVAGTAAGAAACTPGADGSAYATTCPAGHGTGLVELQPIVPGSPTTMPLSFGVTGVTTGVGGAMTASLSIWIPSVTLLPLTATTPLTYAPATSAAGPSFTMDVRQTVTPPLYGPSDLSLNDLTLRLDGLVTDSATGTVSPAVPFVRQSTVCTSVTSTLSANARGPQTVSAPFTQTVTGCPAAPHLVSVEPVAGQPRTFTFTTTTPTAGVPGRTAAQEWVFGDGSKAVTGAVTTHTFPVAKALTAVVTTVDSAGARGTSLQVELAASRLRAKQRAGDLVTGLLADQDSGQGVVGQQVRGYRCATRSTPVGSCTDVGTTRTKSAGRFRLHLPDVTTKGFVLLTYGGDGTSSPTKRARFGTSRYVAVLPQPDVTLKVSDLTVRPGSTVRLSGHVHPGKRGKTVRLQGLLRGKWRSIGTATLSARGHYVTTYVVHAPGQGKVKVRAKVPGTAATFVAISKVRVIHLSG